MWIGCSLSEECVPSCSAADTCSLERLACSDDCVETKEMARRQAEQKMMMSSEQLAILANTATMTQSCLLVFSPLVLGLSLLL